MLSETTILKAVTINYDPQAIEVLWADQVLRDDEVIAETLRRKAYTPEQRAELEAEVQGGAAIATAAGW